MPALTPDVGRAGALAQETFETHLRDLAAEFAARMPSAFGPPRERALATIALFVGGVMLARGSRTGSSPARSSAPAVSSRSRRGPPCPVPVTERSLPGVPERPRYFGAGADPGRWGGRGRVQLLRTVTYLQDVSPLSIAVVANRARWRSVPPRQVIFREGDPCRDLHVLVEGRVEC